MKRSTRKEALESRVVLLNSLIFRLPSRIWVPTWLMNRFRGTRVNARKSQDRGTSGKIWFGNTAASTSPTSMPAAPRIRLSRVLVPNTLCSGYLSWAT